MGELSEKSQRMIQRVKIHSKEQLDYLYKSKVGWIPNITEKIIDTLGGSTRNRKELCCTYWKILKDLTEDLFVTVEVDSHGLGIEMRLLWTVGEKSEYKSSNV